MELIKNLNSTEITFSQPFGNDGKNYSKILYNNNQDKQVYLVTEYLKCPFGPTSFDEGVNWSASLSAQGNEEDMDKINNFFSQIENLENKLIDHALEYSIKAFGKKHKSRDVVEALFSKTIKLSLDKNTKEPDGKFPPRISPKFDIKDGKLRTIIKDSKNNVINVNSVQDLPNIIGKHSLIKAIIKPNVYYIGGKFGMSLKYHTIKFKLNQNQPTGNELDSDVEDDGVEEEKVSTQKSTTDTTFVNDSDNEESGEDNEDNEDNKVEEDEGESSSDDDDDDEEEAPKPKARGRGKK